VMKEVRVWMTRVSVGGTWRRPIEELTNIN
jgi:hypothetical protein